MRYAALILLALTGCSLPVSLELSAASNLRPTPVRRYPVKHALTLLRAPPPITITIQPPAKGDPYAALLALLLTAPGGQGITRADVALFISLTRQIPLGLPLQQYPAIWWGLPQSTQTTLQAMGLPFWNGSMSTWLLVNQSQLWTAIALTRALLAQPTPAPVTVQVSQDTRPQLLALWGNWTQLLEQGPDLIAPLVKWAGLDRPTVVAYGGESGYTAGLVMTSKKGLLHVVEPEGYHVVTARGLQDTPAWPGDKSLTYYPAEIERGKIRPLDVVASKRYRAFRYLTGGEDTLEPVWSLHTAAIGSVGPFRAGYVDGEHWAGLTWTGGPAWARAHVAVGYPYSEFTGRVSTPWQCMGASARITLAALWDTYLQADARATASVWAGPEWLRLKLGLTWAVAPSKLGHWQSSLKPVLIRRHVDMILRKGPIQAEATVSVSRLGEAGRWSVGYHGDWWSVSLIGDVIRDLIRWGFRAELGPFKAVLLTGQGSTEANIGVQYTW